ncbi:MAG: DNA internalization-related competence protein ComEC/Rec2 [Halioglobus sp.]
MKSWMIGLIIGLASVGFFSELPPWPIALLLGALSIIALWLRHLALINVIGGLCCGCALGIVHGAVLLQSRLPQDCVGESIVVSGHVSSLPGSRRVLGQKLQQRFEFTVAKTSPDECSGSRNLMLSYYGEKSIVPGARWQFEVKLKRPWGLANPGSYNMQAWFAQHGIDAVGNVRQSKQTHALPEPWLTSFSPDRLRHSISARISALQIDSDVRAVLRAVTVADSAGIDSNLWSVFQQYGINHLLVISGLHIGMVAAVGYFFGGIFQRILWRFIAGTDWLPGGCALLLACIYTTLAGFSLPTQRALCMLACFLIAALLGRTSSSANSLLLAAVFVLLLNPLAALGSGFWLSFGAVAALLWFSRWQRGISVAGRLLRTHAGMSLMMLPLGAHFFGGASVVSLLANVLMIPVVGWLVIPLALMAVVSSVFGGPLESTLWQLAAWPLQIVLPLANSLARVAGGWLYVPFAAGLESVLLAIVAVAFVFMPGRYATIPLAAVLALPMLLPEDRSLAPPSLSTTIAVLDVGQGTAVVVRSGDLALLYDTGGGDPQGPNLGTSTVLPFLRDQGVQALDTLVISHPDLDHSAGATAIMASMPVERLRYGRASPGSGGGRACVAGESWRWPGGQIFQFLSPALETPLSSNDSSCVLRIQIGDYLVLLPGDIEQGRERDLVAYWNSELRSNWLLAAHHGSRTSSSATILKHVQPDVVVLSNGYANRFGHPHPVVVDRLQQHGASSFSTATHGALQFEVTPGGSLTLKAFRQEHRRYWM